MPRNAKSKQGGWHDSVQDFRSKTARRKSNCPVGLPENPAKKGDRVRAAVERLRRRSVILTVAHANIPTNEQAAEQSDREATEEYDEVVRDNQE